MLRRASYAVSVQFRPLNSSSFVAQTHSYVRWQSAKRIAEITVRLDDADQPEGFEALSVLTEPFSATPLAD